MLLCSTKIIKKNCHRLSVYSFGKDTDSRTHFFFYINFHSKFVMRKRKEKKCINSCARDAFVITVNFQLTNREQN